MCSASMKFNLRPRVTPSTFVASRYECRPHNRIRPITVCTASLEYSYLHYHVARVFLSTLPTNPLIYTMYTSPHIHNDARVIFPNVIMTTVRGTVLGLCLISRRHTAHCTLQIFTMQPKVYKGGRSYIFKCGTKMDMEGTYSYALSTQYDGVGVTCTLVPALLTTDVTLEWNVVFGNLEAFVDMY